VPTKLGEASVEINVDLAKFKRQLEEAAKITGRMADRMAKSLDRVGKKLQSIGKSFSTKLTAPMLLAGAAIGKVTSDFDLSLSRIVGLVGVAESQVKSWREEILLLGPAVGKGPNELAEGLFFITSAGVRGSAAMTLLEQSAKAASAGLGDTKVVADAATSAVNAYGAANLDAGTAIGILVGTVREGKAEAASIAGVMGQVLPIAAELGVSFDQVGATIAAMTRLGLPAEEAVTSLKATMSSLTKVTPDAEVAIKEMGLSLETLQEDLRKPGGLLNVLTQLKAKVDTTGVEMTRIFPNIRALTGVLGLVGKNAAITKEIFEALAKDGVQTLDTAFNVVAKESGFKFNQGMVRINNSMVRLGDVLLPVVVPLITKFTKAIDKAALSFSKLDASTKAWIVIAAGIGVVLGPVLIGVGLLAIGLGALIIVMKSVATAAVFMGRMIGTAMLKILSVPGLIIGGFVALAVAIVVFKETAIGVATGVYNAFKKSLVTQFNNDIARPFISLLNNMFDFLPAKVQEMLSFLKPISVPDIIEGTLGDDLSNVLQAAFAQGKIDADNFKGFLQETLGNLSDAFNIGGGEGLLAEMEDQFEKLKGLFAETGDSGSKAAEVYQSRWLQAAAAAKEGIKDSLEDMILNFRSLGEMVRSIAKIIRDELLRALIAKPIAGFVSDLIGTSLGLGAAGGGDISGPTLVGERGPEIFNPKGAGTILNNSNSKRMLGSGGGVTVVQNITFTTDVQKTVRAEIVNAAPILSNAAATQVFDQMRRQGRG